MKVRLVADGDEEKWDAFCTANRLAFGCFFKWREVLRSWGHVPVFLLAEDDEGASCRRRRVW